MCNDRGETTHTQLPGWSSCGKSSSPTRYSKTDAAEPPICPVPRLGCVSIWRTKRLCLPRHFRADGQGLRESQGVTLPPTWFSKASRGPFEKRPTILAKKKPSVREPATSRGTTQNTRALRKWPEKRPA